MIAGVFEAQFGFGSKSRSNFSHIILHLFASRALCILFIVICLNGSEDFKIV